MNHSEFHGGHCERIIWRSWVARTVLEFVLSCLAWFCIAFSYEALKFLRQHLHKRSVLKTTERITLEIEVRRNGAHPPGCTNASPLPLPEIEVKSHVTRIFASDHITQSLLNVVQVAISYLLMLVFMTYNYWLCLSVVLGLGLGYFCFGWIAQNHNTIAGNDCCT
ncbi:high affinity copper uptake protein 1 isoform X5 [Eurosta solidaginis]|uniref:high affinity copper uptake protein 1 isoform X5 n=1 Tax=Eurosta solidaginis TaxID=178769 RepID=UPI0035306720